MRGGLQGVKTISPSLIGSQSDSTPACLSVPILPPGWLIVSVKKEEGSGERHGERRSVRGREGLREEQDGIMSMGVGN